MREFFKLIIHRLHCEASFTVTLFSMANKGSFCYVPIAHHKNFIIEAYCALWCYHLPVTPLNCWILVHLWSSDTEHQLVSLSKCTINV